MFFDWLEQFLQHMYEWSGPYTFEKILTAAIASAIGIVIFKIIINVMRTVKIKLNEFREMKRRIQNARNAVSENSRGVWLSRSPEFPKQYDSKLSISIPIMTVANLKGGVGKTTIAANLAAHYTYSGETVLLVDLDFQGSLSAMMRNGVGGQDKASRLLTGRSANILFDLQERLHMPWVPLGPEKIARNLSPNFSTEAFGIPAFYDLARTDNRIMVEWLLGYCEADPRYWLAEALLEPTVQSRYDRIIIDAPPRMVTGCIQALCSSTCVIIPTVLDQLSSDAVDRFITQLEEEQHLWPMLKIAGVVATMCSPKMGTPNLVAHEKDTIRQLIDRLENHPTRAQLFWKDAFIPDNSLLSRAAGQGIAYANISNDKDYRSLRQTFCKLAEAIEYGLRGERTYENWKAWLIDQDFNPSFARTQSNGSGNQPQPPHESV